MKTLKDFIRKKISSLVVARYRVPSRSDKGDYHLVEILKDGRMVCDCMAGCFSRNCYHKKVIEKYLQKGRE